MEVRFGGVWVGSGSLELVLIIGECVCFGLVDVELCCVELS